MPMNLNPADRSLTAGQIDRKYAGYSLRSRLGDRREDVGKPKADLVRAYMEALRSTPQTKSPADNVRVVKRVELDGKGCNGTSSHTVAFETHKDGVRIYADADEGEDSDMFHTTLADLKAAIAALEANA